MLSYYCLKCKKDTENKNPKVAKTKNGRKMLLSNFVVCNSKNQKFLKQQEPSGLLSSLGIKTPLTKIPLVGPISFCYKQVNTRYKMNEIVNKFVNISK